LTADVKMDCKSYFLLSTNRQPQRKCMTSIRNIIHTRRQTSAPQPIFRDQYFIDIQDR